MNINIGQYYPIKSLVHSLDARTKICFVIFFMVGIFLTSNFLGYFVSLLFLIIFIFFSRIPLKIFLKNLSAVKFIIIFTFVVNILFYTEGNVLIKFSIIKITDQSILYASKIAFRIILLIVSASTLTYTTTPMELTYGLEKMFYPLTIFNVPVSDIAMMITIALRFIPIIAQEFDKIKNAQISRGAELDARGFIKKAKNLIPILVPLFVSSFKRADDLAISMESRCYQSGVKRTRFKPTFFKKIDYLGFLFISFYIICIICIKIFFEA